MQPTSFATGESKLVTFPFQLGSNSQVTRKSFTCITFIDRWFKLSIISVKPKIGKSFNFNTYFIPNKVNIHFFQMKYVLELIVYTVK